MPDQHCPTCGTARSAGCRCIPDPAAAETAVLPHVEGPPLVRPYVPQALGQVTAEHVPGPPPVDPFATALLPTAPPAGPGADAFATALLPPVLPVPPAPRVPQGQQLPQGQQAYPQQPQPQQAYEPGYEQHPQQPHPQQPYEPGYEQHPQPYDTGYETTPHPDQPRDGEEIGFFPFNNAMPEGPDGHGTPSSARPAGRAARRAAEQGPARRKGLMVAAGAGLLALTVGLAYAVTPSGSDEPDDRQAKPAPSVTVAPGPVDPTTAAPPSPSAEPSSSSAGPSPTKTAKPTATRTPTAVATTPVAPAPAPPVPAAPTDPAPTATTPVSTAPSTPSPAPTTTAPPRVLTMGMTGADVKDMQLRLVAASCGLVDDSLASGRFDWWTLSVLRDYQDDARIKGESGEYGPKTRAKLEGSTPSC